MRYSGNSFWTGSWGGGVVKRFKRSSILNRAVISRFWVSSKGRTANYREMTAQSKILDRQKNFFFWEDEPPERISRISHPKKNPSFYSFESYRRSLYCSKSEEGIWTERNSSLASASCRNQDRKQGSVTHCTTFMTECRSQDRAMAYFLISRFT